jgi:hypothetical protein
MTSILHDEATSARLLLAAPDTLHISADIPVSERMMARLDQEREKAQQAEGANKVHCPEWLGAQVHPHGARGGYRVLIETPDFSVKVLGSGIPNRPGLFVELHSHFLHTHVAGAPGACKEALGWLRTHLLADQKASTVKEATAFEGVRLSRADLHADWQGGWVPSPLDGALNGPRRFIKPARVKWHSYTDGTTFTGFVFGSGPVLARIYHKSHQAHERLDDAYFALLAERNGDVFDPALDMWRLEYQLRREGVKGFRLYDEPDSGDEDAAIDAELAAEDLAHLGTLPRFFAHQALLWQYLTLHWLRLVVPDVHQSNRSRWPLDPTWRLLHDGFAQVAGATPLDEKARALVRGAQYTGKSRLLRRMLLGVVSSLEVTDAAPSAAALAALEQWVERIAAKEEVRAARRRAQYAARFGKVPRWVEHGMGERLARVQQVSHRVQMLLGIFAARGVLPLELKPAQSVADLLLQHLDDLEAEAEEKGGIEQVLGDHFAKVYKVAAPRELLAPIAP